MEGRKAILDTRKNSNTGPHGTLMSNSGSDIENLNKAVQKSEKTEVKAIDPEELKTVMADVEDL